MSWLNLIIEAMSRLGGDAKYPDLYDMVKDLNIKDIDSCTNYKAIIRGTIEKNSSDSKLFNGKTDIFYSIGGNRSGHWGLRDFIVNEDNVAISEDDSGFPEGKKILRMHICRERNQNLINNAKKSFKKKHGRLYCEICNFDFFETYGKIGEDYIEGHHLIPVSQLSDYSVTKTEDIALVCSNCHKMLHRKRPWLTTSDLKNLLR